MEGVVIGDIDDYRVSVCHLIMYRNQDTAMMSTNMRVERGHTYA